VKASAAVKGEGGRLAETSLADHNASRKSARTKTSDLLENISSAFNPEQMAQRDNEHGAMQLTMHQIQLLSQQIQDQDSIIDRLRNEITQLHSVKHSIEREVDRLRNELQVKELVAQYVGNSPGLRSRSSKASGMA